MPKAWLICFEGKAVRQYPDTAAGLEEAIALLRRNDGYTMSYADEWTQEEFYC